MFFMQVDLLDCRGEFDYLVLYRVTAVVLVIGKQQFLCGQLPNVMFLHGCKFVKAPMSVFCF